MKGELDAQVVEKQLKAVAEVEQKKVYHSEEVAQLERWKLEELQKVTQKNIAIDKLNVEREAQLTDKARRKAEQMSAKKQAGTRTNGSARHVIHRVL